MHTVVLCYGLMVTWPVASLGAWLAAHHVRVVYESPVVGALYVGHSLGAARCAGLARVYRGRSVGIDPVPPAGDVQFSAAALGDNHLSVVNDPRVRAYVLRLVH